MVSQRQLATVEPTSLRTRDVDAQRGEWDLMMDQAKVMAESGFFGKLTPPQALAKMMTGKELGLGMMQALRSIHVIEGKPTLSADLMAGLVQDFCRKHGGYLRTVEQTAERCSIEFKRQEWPDTSSVSFTVAEAQAAGLMKKDVWRFYTTDMLKARALTRACRTGWPDVCAGLYDPDELGGVIETTATVRPLRPVVDDPPLRAPDEAEEATFRPETPPRDEAETAMRALHAVARERGLAHAGIKAVAAELFGYTDSLTGLDGERLRALAEAIKAAEDEDIADWSISASAAPVDAQAVDGETGEIIEAPAQPGIDLGADMSAQIEADYLRRINLCGNLAALEIVGDQIKHDGISTAALRAAYQRKKMALTSTA